MLKKEKKKEKRFIQVREILCVYEMKKMYAISRKTKVLLSKHVERKKIYKLFRNKKNKKDEVEKVK